MPLWKFTAPPEMEMLSTIFLQTYHRFADHFFACYQNLMPFTMLESSQFQFEIFASDDSDFGRLFSDYLTRPDAAMQKPSPQPAAITEPVTADSK